MAVDREHPGPGDGRATPSGPEWQRRRRLATVFGDVLPDTTRDERGEGGEGPAGGGSADDERYLREVPPHHG